VIVGTSGNDLIDALAGNDTVPGHRARTPCAQETVTTSCSAEWPPTPPAKPSSESDNKTTVPAQPNEATTVIAMKFMAAQTADNFADVVNEDAQISDYLVERASSNCGP